MTAPDKDDSPATVVRSKTIEVTLAGPQRYSFRGRLTDMSLCGDYGPECDPPETAGSQQRRRTIHDFGVNGLIEGRDLVLADLTVEALTHPYGLCPVVIPRCRVLVGHSLTTGWRRMVLKALGGSSGCTHVTTLLLGLAEARTLVFFLEMNAKTPYTKSTRSDGRWTATGLEVAPSIVGACHALADTGSVIRTARHRSPRPNAGVDHGG
jgi:Protein of unknown function (DUF2889)